LEHTDGSLYLVVGGSGGSRIFPSVVQVILAADSELATSQSSGGKEAWVDVSRAVESPRAHNQLYPLIVDVDSTIDKEGVDALAQRGHNVTGETFASLVDFLGRFLTYFGCGVVSDINRVAAAVQAVLVTKDGRIFGESHSLPFLR
jgi:gamma-glutamyltranspeptidase/glutathione hydrolase/leukotriene-C4 hydrolase